MSNWLIGKITSTSYLSPEVSMNLGFKETFASKVVNKRLTFNAGMDKFPRYVLEHLIDNSCFEYTIKEDSSASSAAYAKTLSMGPRRNGFAPTSTNTVNTAASSALNRPC